MDAKLPFYARVVDDGWTEAELMRLYLHELPRTVAAMEPDERARHLGERPPLTGTHWDALLAAVAEHLCELHGMEPPAWSQERERFLRIPWIVGVTREMQRESTAFAPAAFIRHGAIANPRELDARGGEVHVWVPGSQPHHEAVREALRRT